MLRWSKRILLVLVAGMVVNWVVAVGLMAWMPLPNAGQHSIGYFRVAGSTAPDALRITPGDTLEGMLGLASSVVASEVVDWVQDLRHDASFSVNHGSGKGVALAVVVVGKVLHDGSANTYNTLVSGFRLQSGLPFIAFEAKKVQTIRHGRTVKSNVSWFEMPVWFSRWYPDSDRRPDATRPFPVQPLWAGFVLNTVFYAVCLFVAGWGFMRIKRTRRRRRRCCEVCTYPVAGLATCPECGASTNTRGMNPAPLT